MSLAFCGCWWEWEVRRFGSKGQSSGESFVRWRLWSPENPVAFPVWNTSLTSSTHSKPFNLVTLWLTFLAQPINRSFAREMPAFCSAFFYDSLVWTQISVVGKSVLKKYSAHRSESIFLRPLAKRQGQPGSGSWHSVPLPKFCEMRIYPGWQKPGNLKTWN